MTVKSGRFRNVRRIPGLQPLAERWHRVGDRRVRSLCTAQEPGDGLDIVVIPGLGAVRYLVPFVQACGAWGRVHLLDLPGFGHPETARCPATLADAVTTATAWLDTAIDGPVVLAGHSTGAQAALHVAVARPERVGVLVMAGPTFPPQARRWLGLVQRVARTLVHESPSLLPLTLPDYIRSRGRMLTLLCTAMADEPERLTADLSCPLVVLRGEKDAVSTARWAEELAAGAADGDVVVLPGAHNFPYQRSAETALALLDAVTKRAAP